MTLTELPAPLDQRLNLVKISEAFVAWLWDSRSYRTPLHSLDGERVQVVYPGWRWGSWGPDFHAAALALGTSYLRGDVEIHVHARDWERHGHATDPAYAGVVLHVVYAPDGVPPCQRADGVLVPVVTLADQLAEPVEQLLNRWQGAARGAVAARPCLQPGDALPVLEHAGLERFRAKAARFEGDLTCVAPGQALWAGVLEALGYANNTTAFLRLADRLPLADACVLAATDPPMLEAIALGEAGLLPSQQGRLAPDGHALALDQLWRGSHRTGPLLGLPWRWVGGRPANTPPRRVAATASLLIDAPGWPSARNIAEVLLGASPRRAARLLREQLVRAGTEYWQVHADLGRPTRRPGAVLGPQRAAEIVVNVVLPWASALGRTWDQEEIVRAAEACYRAHPLLGSNHLTRHMSAQILGPEAGSVITTACRQQGLIHIYRNTCDGRDCAACLARPHERSRRG